MGSPSRDDLTTVELLVLYEAGGDNDLGNAYGAVQLYEEFQELEELLDVTNAALLRLFDLGLVRFVEAPPDVGYTSKRFELPAMTRDQVVATLERERESADTGSDALVSMTQRLQVKRSSGWFPQTESPESRATCGGHGSNRRFSPGRASSRQSRPR